VVLDNTAQARSQLQGQRKRAKSMRRELTNAEKLFWWEVKDRRLEGHKFRRQHPIGPYIADFACIEGKLVVEVDGGQHADAVTYDQQRDSYLQAQGFRVLRFWNADVLTNMEGVIDAVLSVLNGATGSPSP
jgi:very-short-patch-repair endonuclease